MTEERTKELAKKLLCEIYNVSFVDAYYDEHELDAIVQSFRTVAAEARKEGIEEADKWYHEYVIGQLGEAIHTSFRKATDCKQAHPIWKLIQEMPADHWQSVLHFIQKGFEYDGGLKTVVERLKEQG